MGVDSVISLVLGIYLILFIVKGLFLAILMLAVAKLLNRIGDIVAWVIEEAIDYRHADYLARQGQEALERGQVLPEDLIIPFAFIAGVAFGLLFAFYGKI
jgi:hypothetical protein